ncbi:DNA repair protein RecO [methane-oxidizing endosymbiont of Gigantopelta aegis]|uniref:DNA repair protein RecO n=1 Tax=methane-oxidizing endosymbiont of Gigantopelta aegis TaxID=2794938 RepID=UPI0018DC7FFA|nr:DNA repair protein RecO [methane-oxidizing endosymbiont of Gigantopelta aegis]
MSRTTVLRQPAFVLQRKNYRETSLIVDVLTENEGVVSLVAKGIRHKKTTLAAILQPFVQLELSWRGQSTLKPLLQAELSTDFSLSGMALYCGFYVNELVHCFLHPYDPNPDVFRLYRRCLADLQSAENVASVLRYFELDLLRCAGYGVSLDQDKHSASIKADMRYRFVEGEGFVADTNGRVSGATLLALYRREALDSLKLQEAKALMREVIDDLLAGKVLKSRAVLTSIMRYR